MITDTMLSALMAHARELSQLQIQVGIADDQLKSLKERARILSEETIPELVAEEAEFVAVDLGDGRKLVIEEDFHLNPPEKRGADSVAWLRATKNDAALMTTVKVSVPKGNDKIAQAISDAAEQYTDSINRQLREQINYLLESFHQSTSNILAAAEIAFEDVRNRMVAARDRLEEDRSKAFAYLVNNDSTIPEDIVTTTQTDINGSTLRSLLLARRASGHDFPEDVFGVYVGRKAKIIEAPKKKVKVDATDTLI